MENNLLGQANNNKGSLNTKCSQIIKINDIIDVIDASKGKLKTLEVLKSLKQGTSSHKVALLPRKPAHLAKSANIVGSYKYLSDTLIPDDIKRLIPSISSINNRKHKVWCQISPQLTLASGRTLKQVGRHCPEPLPEVENGLIGMGFTGNNFFNPINLYNQLNTLGGFKWNK